MKRFSTLLTAAAVFFSMQANAQYSENFESNPTTGSTCVATTDFKHVTLADKPIKDYVIAGSGSGYAEPPVGAAVRIFTTPYLSIPTPLTIDFDYKLSSKLANGAGRFINVGLIDAYGNFSSLDSFGLVDKTDTVQYRKSFNLPTATTARVSFRMGGFGGDGNTRVVYDNIVINAPMINGGLCNATPIALSNTYYPMLLTEIVSGNVMTDNTGNDSDPDGGNLTATLLTSPAPTAGALTFNADGSFDFAPAVGFSGGIIQFSYRITDDGYPRASATTTVTLEYPVLAPLPVKLMSFAGSINSNKALLKWSVADNETGDQFQVLRSSDAKNFTEAGTVFISNKPGAESYTFNDGKELDAVTYYKLKIVNKDGSVSYSNVIALKSASTKPTTGINIMQNPVESTLTFTYSATAAVQGQVAIYNTLGVKVYSQRISSQKGTNSVSLNLDSHLAAGTYILEVVNGADRAVTRMIKR